MTFLRSIAIALIVSMASLAASAQDPPQPVAELSNLPAVRNDSVGLPDEPLRLAELPAPLAIQPQPLQLPKAPPEHRFFDSQQRLALYVHSGVRLADTIKTCRALAHGGVEEWIPSQSCAGVAAWQAGSIGVALGVGWLLHKHGAHRLERIVPWIGAGASAAGLTKSIFNLH